MEVFSTVFSTQVHDDMTRISAEIIKVGNTARINACDKMQNTFQSTENSYFLFFSLEFLKLFFLKMT